VSVVAIDVAPSASEATYQVRIGRGLLAEAQDTADGFSHCFVLTDRNVAAQHLKSLGPALGHEPAVLEPGEASKNAATLTAVLESMAASDLDRQSLVVTLGGGVICDLGGLAASLFMRGIGVLHCPTTLLAQVDASVGGKTAINLSSGRNLAGTFHQPLAVLADVDTLATLPEIEFRSGLGEALKTALLVGEDLLHLLEGQAEAVGERDPDLLQALVAGCVRAKADIVAADEREEGPRKALNLGHTFAHGIETAAGPGRIPHGQAVAVGLAMAGRCAEACGVLEDDTLPERIEAILGALDLPRSLQDLAAAFGADLTPTGVILGMRHDKKGRAGTPALVLPRSLGKVALDFEPEDGLLEKVLA